MPTLHDQAVVKDNHSIATEMTGDNKEDTVDTNQTVKTDNGVDKQATKQ